MPYQSSSRISDLLLQRGRARADTERYAGQATARGIQDVASTVAGTIGELVRLKTDASRQERDKLALDRERREYEKVARQDRDRETMNKVVTMFKDDRGGVNHQGVINKLRTAQRPDLAQSYEDDWRERSLTFANNAQSRINQLRTPLGRAQQIYAEVSAQPDLYARFRPELLEIAGQVHPSLAQSLPETYDPAHLKQATEFLSGTLSTLDQQDRAFKKFKETQDRTLDAAKVLAAQREMVGRQLQTSTTAESHQASLALLREANVPAQMIAPWTEWSADLPKRAERDLLMDEKDRREAARLDREEGHMASGSEFTQTFNVIYDAEAAKLGRKLTPPERAKVIARVRDELTKTGDGPKASDVLTIAAVMEHPTQYRGLDSETRSRIAGELYRRGFTFPDDDAHIYARDRDEYDDYRDAHDKYYATAGAGGLPMRGRPAPMSFQKWKTANKPDFSPTTTAAPADRRDIGLPTATRPAPPTTAPPVRTAMVPQSVRDLLANEPADEYELNDGSVWEKAANGTIRRVR